LLNIYKILHTIDHLDHEFMVLISQCNAVSHCADSL